jgi:hypothetical protein
MNSNLASVKSTNSKTFDFSPRNSLKLAKENFTKNNNLTSINSMNNT